ncbi:uncharacterized protein LOC102801511 [Saccoglossus kowalevskii]|uniref:UPF0676 protein C1494.01-like n=1 Tax=Saccoglossus kowalevskii TaxID=10224 RepID=A0ABM0MVN4_SACKO|nr:PREDICTED: UPF0676 protein C1494.01-like [Saccoglossus kowalevskii]
MAAQTIPVFDFSAYNLNRNTPDAETYQKLIDDIDNAFQQSANFFTLPTETKVKYSRPDNSNHGYVAIGSECLSANRPGDYKESFNYIPLKGEANTKIFPNEEVPKFSQALTTLYQECIQLINRILEVVGRGLPIEDPLLFVKAHEGLNSEANMSTLRTVWYPPIQDDDLKTDQIRCGEHVDYGSITLVFQDDKGGLQMACEDGSFIDVKPEKGGVFVNLGYLMERWTSDTLKARVHRVVNPESSEIKKQARQSLICFVNPDKACIIKCVDRSNKYPPITSMDFLNMKFGEVYQNFQTD